MKKTDLVFVVLVYRNAEDLENFIKSVENTVKGMHFDIVVVNSYFDKKSEEEIRKVTERYHHTFLNVENKGYSFGNNFGIDYVINHYEFKWLIVSNPDILVEKFDLSNYSFEKNEILGPYIVTSNGKMQNPHWYRENHFSEKLLYKAFRNENRYLLYAHLLIQKIPKILLHVKMKIFNTRSRVFAVHGSFIIFSYHTIEKIKHPFDEDMFLFAEENHLAHLAKKNEIEVWVVPEIRVRHLEDGSVGVADINVKSNTRESVITYYEKWFPDSK